MTNGEHTFYTTKSVTKQGVFYKLFNASDLSSVLEGDLSYIKLENSYIIYVKDNKLYLSNYQGQDLLHMEIPLYFTNYNGSGIKAFSIDILGNQLRVATPKANTSTHYTVEYYFDAVTYSYIRTRDNVKETIE